MQQINGFSMIELLIVVTIIGLLASIGLPAYNKQIEAIKRTDGKASLLGVQSNMERYLFDNDAYPENLAMMKAYQTNAITSKEGYYEINLVEASSSCPASVCYILRAVPKVGPDALTPENELFLSSNGTRSGTW